MLSTFLATLVISPLILASTHPLTGSSIINKPINGLAFSQMGFKVNGVPDFWVYNKSLTSLNDVIEIGPSDKTILSFRLENTSPKTQLEAYVRQFLKDYNQYGFEVTGLQSLTRNDLPTVIVDLDQKNKSTKSRQMFFHKNNKIIVATCADETSKFEETIKVCNQILNSFSWK